MPPAGRAPRLLARLHADESGLASGADALVFGVLVFVIGTLLFVTTWTAIDAKFATSAAAREGVRAAVEAPAGQPPLGPAEAAARAALAGHGLDPDRAAIVPVGSWPDGLRRCQEVELRVVHPVPVAPLPLLERRAVFEVTGRHREVVDPFRAGLDVGGACAY